LNAKPRETLVRIYRLMAALGAAFTLILLGASLTYSRDASSCIDLRVSFHGVSVRL
jgi:hypothetical protein